MSTEERAIMDVASLAALLGWFADYLPAVATLLTAVWYGLRIYETWVDIKKKKGQD